MKKILLTVQVLLLWGIGASLQAQTEHYAGLAISNVIGPSYTLRHNRWSVVADAGWLTGFKGIYASAGGMYELLSMNRLIRFFKIPSGQNSGDGFDMLMSMGLGVFAQDYYSPSARQRRWADKLSYVAPLGCNAMCEMCWRREALPDWSFALRFRLPLYFTAREYEDVLSKGAGVAMPATWQIVVQRKF